MQKEFYDEKLHAGNAIDCAIVHGGPGINNRSNVIGPDREREIQNFVHGEAVKKGRDGTSFRDRQWRQNLRRRIRRTGRHL